MILTTRNWISSLSLGGLLLLAAQVQAGDLKDRQQRLPKSNLPVSHFVARRLIDGEITKLDRKSNVVVIKIPTGTLTMASPRLSATSLSKGDRVEVELRLVSASTRASLAVSDGAQREEEPAILQRQLDARVMGISAGRGTVRFRTSAGPLEVDLPSTILKQFKRGESTRVELTVRPPGTAARAERAGLATLLLSILGKR